MPSTHEAAVNASAARLVADYLAGIVAGQNQFERASYGHMGATLTDTALQAGLNYKTVVLPRVAYILSVYPEANTTTKFLQLLCEVGPGTLLRWSNAEKIDRLCRLIGMLRANSIETEPQLAEWLCSTRAVDALLAIKGIGPKTVDYLKILVGIPTVAVDRHVRTLFRIVGVESTNYQDLREIICQAADILEMKPHVLDAIIWQHVSSEQV